MKPTKLVLQEITEFELNLAKNDRALAFAREIVKLSLADRTQRLQNLRRKIQEGNVSLFEENVLTKLLEHQTAEKISAISQNLAAVEAELQKRQSVAQKQPVAAEPPQTTSTKRNDDYPSELLTFLASQKPPPLPTKKAVEPAQTTGAASAQKQAIWQGKDLLVGSVLVILFAFALWYTVTSKESPSAPATFARQAVGRADAPQVTAAAPPALQAQFDAALQQLRFGVFDQGQRQLLDLIQAHPQTAPAEDAYLAIADTYRQRRNNPAEALKYYQTFIEKYPQSSRVGLAQLKMGFAYEDLEDPQNAAEIYRLLLNQYGAKSRLGQLASERLSALQTPDKRN